MTTDTADKTEVTQEAPPEEPKAPPSDAGSTPGADAGASLDATQDQTQDEPVFETAEAYAEAMAAKEGAGEAPEAVARKPLVDPTVVARERTALDTNYRARQKFFDDLDFDAYNLETPGGRKKFVEDAKNKVNEEHADVLSRGHYEAEHQAYALVSNDIAGGINALDKPLSEAIWQDVQVATKESKNANVPYAQLLKIIADRAEKHGAKRYREEGFKAGRTARDATAGGAKSGQGVNGMGPDGKPADDTSILESNTSTLDQKKAAYKRLYGHEYPI